MTTTGLRCECCETGRHDLCKGDGCGCDCMFWFGRTEEDVERLAKRALLLDQRIALLIHDLEQSDNPHYAYIVSLLRDARK